MEPWALSFRVQDRLGVACAVPQSPVLSLIFPATNLKFLILGCVLFCFVFFNKEPLSSLLYRIPQMTEPVILRTPVT